MSLSKMSVCFAALLLVLGLCGISTGQEKLRVDDETVAVVESPWIDQEVVTEADLRGCLLYTSPSPRDKRQSRMPSSA